MHLYLRKKLTFSQFISAFSKYRLNFELFSQYFSTFLQSRLNFEHFKKRTTIIADVFPKLRTPKNVVI